MLQKHPGQSEFRHLFPVGGCIDVLRKSYSGRIWGGGAQPRLDEDFRPADTDEQEGSRADRKRNAQEWLTKKHFVLASSLTEIKFHSILYDSVYIHTNSNQFTIIYQNDGNQSNSTKAMQWQRTRNAE